MRTVLAVTSSASLAFAPASVIEHHQIVVVAAAVASASSASSTPGVNDDDYEVMPSSELVISRLA